jgi:hypothetical protein
MPAEYWLAKYVDDAFRNEPRNVGIIVSTPEGLAARFAGERDDLTMDKRRLGQRFRYADVYLQWVDYWREQIEKNDLAEILGASTPNYYIVRAGEVSDTGADSPAVICNFLYNLLVSDASVMEAFELATETDAERDLSLDVSSTFAEWQILSDSPTLHVRYPIRKKQPIRGGHATHEPSFSQQNATLSVFEAIDFTAKKPKLLRERAGFMAYMFSDIRQLLHEGVQAYSIVRPASEGEAGEAIEYARAMLSGESTIVNWADIGARDVFLRERRAVAESLPIRFALGSGQSGPTGPASPPLLSR